MEELFNRHIELANRYRQLAGIVQNDWTEFPPTRENFIEYNKLHAEILLEIYELQNDIIANSYDIL